MCDYQRSFGLKVGFIDHFNPRLVTTLNFSANTELHTLEVTTAHAKSFMSAGSSPMEILQLLCQLHRPRFLFTVSLTILSQLTNF
jgi:hypothetical protein